MVTSASEKLQELAAVTEQVLAVTALHASMT
jgi:hypothetical protein